MTLETLAVVAVVPDQALPDPVEERARVILAAAYAEGVAASFDRRYPAPGEIEAAARDASAYLAALLADEGPPVPSPR